MLKILQEAICYAFLYSMFIVIMCVKQGPEKQIYNYPSSIQNRLIKEASSKLVGKNLTCKY